METGIQAINQIMNRWANNLRLAQTTQTLNNDNIMNLNLFDLSNEEYLQLKELNSILTQKGNKNHAI